MEYANNDFKKGRAFGTEGEWDAADYLFREMGNLSLNPILDEIQEITTGFESYPIIEPKKIDITDRLDVTSQSLTINESGSEYADLAESEFFILPRWNYSEFKDKNNHFLLTHDYSYDDLHIRTDKFHKYWDRPILKNIVKILAEIDNGNISDINDLMNFTKSLIENEFDFTFEDLDINNSSTWPSFFDGDFSLYSEPYLLFAEDPWNNYDPDLPNSLIFLLKLRPHGIFGFGWKLLKFQFQQWWHMGLTNETGNFIGNLFYDFSDNSETHNMPFLLMARPMIFINGEYGEYMMDPDKDLDDFTLDLTWSQEFEEDMLSYNVIGEIVGEDTSKTILVQCLYDSWWCEGTADSAIGMGIVMGIAKYLKELETDYGIKPKYNIQFVACAGEEVGLRGAFYHRANNTGNTGDIPYVIDLNQVAFDERDDIGRPGGDNLTYYVWVMDSNETDHLFLFPKTKALKNEVNAVAEESNYFDRTGGEDFFKVERDPGVPSDQVPYKDATSQDVEPKTILFLKDTGWTLHHRTGQEHAEGDVMEYYDSTDVAVTAEMILNVTKHYAYNSNCWIDGDVAYCAYDQDSDGKVDTIKATFEIETDIPDDPVTVRATFENNNIILNNKTMDKRFNYVIPTNGIEVTVQMTIPPTGDEDHYKLKIELLNATERISDKLTIGQKYPNGESNITDYSPFYVYLYPRGNTEPNKPSLSGPETLKLREENYFTTSATDPNGDDVTFKFYWDYERILGEKEYNEDEIFNSGEECIKGHTYNWPTEKTIRVEAKDCFTNLFDWKKLSWSKNGEWSVLSDPLEYDSDDFENSLDITMSPYSQYSSDSLVAVKDMDMTYYSMFFGETGDSSYEWNFETTGRAGASTQYYDNNAEHNYSDVGLFNVTLNVTDDCTSWNVTRVIEVVNLSASFDKSWNYSIEADETIFFNDSSHGVNSLENWSWDFGDGTNITYGQSVNHSWVFYDYYNVTLTVSDNKSNTSVYVYNMEINNDIFPPEIHYTGYGMSMDDEVVNCTIIANVTDFGRGIDTVKINITSPLGQNGNYTMSYYLDDIYYYHYTDTDVSGEYNYSIWAVDNDNNSVVSSSNFFYVDSVFGNVEEGNQSQSVTDRITGSNFTIYENGTADSISAYIYGGLVFPPFHAKAMIYRANDSVLIGVSEEISPGTGEPAWKTFNFNGTDMVLEKDAEYILSIWADGGCDLYYTNSTESRGWYDSETYTSSPPDPANFNTENRIYSIFCSYKFLPEIKDVINLPEIVGFGHNITISANVTEEKKGIDAVRVNITYPDTTTHLYSLDNTTNNTYECVFSDTWLVGQYDYFIIAKNTDGTSNTSSVYSFNVSANATINVATLKDTYGSSEYINITDPPSPPEDYYLTDRGLTYNKYYDSVSGNDVLEVYTGPVNYQDENEEWTPINETIEMLDSEHPAYSYGYRAVNNKGLYTTYFKPNVQDEWSVAFAYGKSDDPTTYVVRSKLVGVGYLDPSHDWDYEYLQSAQSSQGQIINNTAVYEDVFTGTDVQWTYGNTGLKEEIILGNDARTMLENNPPSDFGLSNSDSYLVFITKLDYQGLTMYNESGDLTGNITITENGVDFKDDLGDFKCALPLGEAYELNNITVNQKLTYRIIQYNGNYYLLSGLKVMDLNEMAFPVVIDPTLNIWSSSSDGEIANINGVYNTAWTATRGTVKDTSGILYMGQSKPRDYVIYRGFVFFNTSSIPENAVIDSATLSLYLNADYSTTDFDITIQNGQPTYPHDPLVDGDYDKSYYSGNGGSLNTNNLVAGYNNISMTEDSWINKTSWTKFCLRSDRDINGISPWGYEYVTFRSADYIGGPAYHPKLVIEYRNQSKIKNIGSTNISGYLLIQVQYNNSGDWVVDNDTINETSPRTINIGEQLALDLIFNGEINTDDLVNGDGTYRVYAAFRDEYGDVLICDDESVLEAWYEFTVDTS